MQDKVNTQAIRPGIHLIFQAPFGVISRIASLPAFGAHSLKVKEQFGSDHLRFASVDAEVPVVESLGGNRDSRHMSSLPIARLPACVGPTRV
jgi:hypothetical protein